MFNWQPNEIELQKLAYISKAKAELSEIHPEKTPSLLLSLFSQDLIQYPVISNKGRVYEKTSLLKKANSTETVVPFTEFKQYLNFYRWKLKQSQQVLIREPLGNTDNKPSYLTQFSRYLYYYGSSFFSSRNPIEKEKQN